jgi:hypothetical protein
MALVFHRGLFVAIASITIAMVRWLRTSPPPVEVMSPVNVDTAHAGIMMAARTRTRRLDETMAPTPAVSVLER